MENYEDLAFKPKMTWEELVEFAKGFGFVETVSSSDVYLRASNYNPVYDKAGYVYIGDEYWFGPISFEDMKTLIPILIMEESK